MPKITKTPEPDQEPIQEIQTPEPKSYLVIDQKSGIEDSVQANSVDEAKLNFYQKNELEIPSEESEQTPEVSENQIPEPETQNQPQTPEIS